MVTESVRVRVCVFSGMRERKRKTSMRFFLAFSAPVANDAILDTKIFLSFFLFKQFWDLVEFVSPYFFCHSQPQVRFYFISVEGRDLCQGRFKGEEVSK